MNRSLSAPVPSATTVRSLVATIAFVALAASAPLATSCARRSVPAARTEEPASSSTMAAAQPSPPRGDASSSAAGGNLAQRLAAEAAARPAAAGPRVEDVATALRRAGLAVTTPSQVLARTIGARYCASTGTPVGLTVAVCEFADDAEAERGLAYSHRVFDRLVPGRTLLRNRSTVLTLGGGGASPALIADATRVSSVFAAL